MVGGVRPAPFEPTLGGALFGWAERLPAWRSYPSVTTVWAMNIQRVGVLGSGIMGSGLAEVAARAGYDVVVRSRSQAGADAMVDSIERGLTKAIERGKATEEE